MKRFFILCALALLAGAKPTFAKTILFVGNSFTYGELSPVKTYKADTVTDLNRSGIGGVPALFKAFATQAGLDYDVSLETVPGVGLDYHYAEKRRLLDRRWDDVVLQSFSTLDQDHAGDPALLVKYAGVFSDMLYRIAAQKTPGIAAVVPVGLAWNRAMDGGLADPNPYDGISAGKIDLWARDHYHASTYGYYLEALLVFGRVTGRDPLSIGDREASIRELSLDPAIVRKLQQIAHDELAAH